MSDGYGKGEHLIMSWLLCDRVGTSQVLSREWGVFLKIKTTGVSCKITTATVLKLNTSLKNGAGYWTTRSRLTTTRKTTKGKGEWHWVSSDIFLVNIKYRFGNLLNVKTQGHGILKKISKENDLSKWLNGDLTR